MNTSSESANIILGKMWMVMKDVDRIEKDRNNAHAKYKYASEKVIKEVLHTVFVKHGIILQISSSNPRLIKTLDKNTKLELAVCMAVDVHYRIYDADSGEFIAGMVTGSGNGRDDKGIYAALTGAIKYMLTSNFLIPTGDDPEANFFDKYLDDEGAPSATAEEPKKKSEVKAPVEQKKVPVTAPASAPTPAPVKKEVEVAQSAIPDPDEPADTKLTEAAQNAVIAGFEQIGIDVWDITKQTYAGMPETWTQSTRRTLLRTYNAIIDKNNFYSKEDFLAGKVFV